MLPIHNVFIQQYIKLQISTSHTPNNHILLLFKIQYLYHIKDIYIIYQLINQISLINLNFPTLPSLGTIYRENKTLSFFILN